MIAAGLSFMVLAVTQAPSEDATVARAEGDRIIAAGQAADIFENISSGNVTRLRHKASGMICVFEPLAPGNNVKIYPQGPATRQRGDDVSCGSNAGAAFTRYATRYKPMPTEAEDLAVSVSQMRGAWSNISPLEIDFTPSAFGGRPAPTFAAFQGRHPLGMDAATFILITHADGWSFKVRASGMPSDAEQIARFADQLLTSALPSSGQLIASPAGSE